MQFRNINALTGYSAALDALTARQRVAHGNRVLLQARVLIGHSCVQ